VDKGRRKVNGGTQNVGIYSKVIKSPPPPPQVFVSKGRKCWIDLQWVRNEKMWKQGSIHALTHVNIKLLK